ncbi:MAG TPA: MerR family transcriptional regulator [Bacillus bacterium]|nr:MerR family transcriptional regulator [Bacillus sp. (in: firmicutes)]
MGSSEGIYTIKAVSSMLGIQPGTLRAWERRYQMIAPIRNESGHRLYTEEHLRILRWLITKSKNGYTISQAISLLDSADSIFDAVEEPKQDYSEGLGDKLLSALLNFNSAKAHGLLDQAFSLFTVDKTVIDLIGPILIKVGDLWEEGSISTAHEHFASSLLRSRIESISNSSPYNSFLPIAVTVCGPGERHELGLLIFTMFLRRKGFEVIFLGTSLAENDIEIVLNKVNPKFLFLSCTLEKNRLSTLNLADEISGKYSDLFIGLGGNAIESMPPQLQYKYKENIVGLSRAEWEKWLKKRIGKMK